MAENEIQWKKVKEVELPQKYHSWEGLMQKYKYMDNKTDTGKVQ